MGIQQRTAMNSDQIYEDLLQKIEKLEYMPGCKLSENELCKVYDVSRHVIRNSLALLKERRLVDVFPQRGTYVSLIDMSYIEDILYMREAVEQEALYRVMQLDDTSELVTKLEKIVDLQKKCLETSIIDNDAFYELDTIFHQALFDAIDRPNIMGLISEPYAHIRRWRNFEIRTDKRMHEIAEEHDAILKEMKEKDVKKGREVLHNHLDTVNRYSQDLKEREPEYFC